VRAFLKRNLPVSFLKLTPRKLAPKVGLPKSSCWEETAMGRMWGFSCLKIQG